MTTSVYLPSLNFQERRAVCFTARFPFVQSVVLAGVLKLEIQTSILQSHLLVGRRGLKSYFNEPLEFVVIDFKELAL